MPLKARIAAGFLLLSLLLGGCSLLQPDALGYVSAMLTYFYRHENAQAYLEYVLLDPDRLEAEYQAGLESDADNFLTHLGVETAHEPLYSIVMPLMEQCNRNISYTLPEHLEQEDGSYLVQLTLHPLRLFGGVTAQELADALAPVWAQYPDNARSGNADFDAAYVQAMVTLLTDKLSAPVYDDAINISLNIDAQEGGYYSLRQEDFENIWRFAVSYF